MSLPIRVGHLGSIEATALLTIAGITNVFLNYPEQLVVHGKQAGWIIPLVSTVVMMAVLLLVSKALASMKDKDILAIYSGGAGKIVCCAGAVLILLFFLLSTASEMRQFAETVLGTVLSRSPISYVSIPLVIVISYFAFSGLESMSRVAWMFAPWFAGAIILLLISDFNWMHFDYLKPVLGEGIPAVLGHGMLFSAAFPNLLLLVIIAGSLRDQSAIKYVGLWSTLIIGLTYTLVTLVFIAMFPAQLSIHMPFPFYQMARLISIGRFFQRLEALFVFLWVACAVIKLAIGLWVCSYLTARIFRMPTYRPLIFSTAIVIYSLAFIPHSYPQVLNWDALSIQRYGILLTAGAPVAFMLPVIFRKGGMSGEKKKRRLA